jgi:hypothetical protein
MDEVHAKAQSIIPFSFIAIAAIAIGLLAYVAVMLWPLLY